MKNTTLVILVCMLMIAAAILPAASSMTDKKDIIKNKIDENKEYDSDQDQEDDNNDQPEKKGIFPIFKNIPRLLNRDWNFWANKPHLYLIRTGNVGIGTKTPAEKLDVVGTVQMTGFKMPTGASNGFVLTSDGTGNGTWQASTGGVGGSGTANSIPKFTGSTTIGDSEIYEKNGNIGIGTTNPQYKLDLVGQFNAISPSALQVINATYTGTDLNDKVAVHGKSRPQDYYGIGGSFEGGYIGVNAYVAPTGSEGYIGVYSDVIGGSGSNVGVIGSAEGAGTNVGILGWASGGASNLAGEFQGDVDIFGTLSKGGGSFKIDHPLDPENKYLYHSFVESPDMMNIYNGNIVLNEKGGATVLLPDWFEALNEEFRYQLTPIGAPGPNLYISEQISGNSFKIAGGTSGMTVSWQVTGIRHDPFADANRIPIEENKSDNEKGKYLYPELYGQPESMEINSLLRDIINK